MKVAYWPGCVSRGFTPELHGSMAKVAPLLDIELVELNRGNCCGAGVIAEHNQELADTLNARTFALAQQTDGVMMMNICSTCQGSQSECQQRLDANSEYRNRINDTLRSDGLRYEKGVVNKNFLWVLVEDIGLDQLKAMVKRPLQDLKVGPVLRLLHRAAARPARHRVRRAARPLPAAAHRGAGRHGHRLRGRVQVLRLPDHHHEQGRLAQAGRHAPGRRGRRRRRLPGHAVPALPPQPRPAAAAGRARRRAATSASRCCTSRSSSAWPSGSTPRSSAWRATSSSRPRSSTGPSRWRRDERVILGLDRLLARMRGRARPSPSRSAGHRRGRQRGGAAHRRGAHAPARRDRRRSRKRSNPGSTPAHHLGSRHEITHLHGHLARAEPGGDAHRDGRARGATSSSATRSGAGTRRAGRPRSSSPSSSSASRRRRRSSRTRPRRCGSRCWAIGMFLALPDGGARRLLGRVIQNLVSDTAGRRRRGLGRLGDGDRRGEHAAGHHRPDRRHHPHPAGRRDGRPARRLVPGPQRRGHAALLGRGPVDAAHQPRPREHVSRDRSWARQYGRGHDHIHPDPPHACRDASSSRSRTPTARSRSTPSSSAARSASTSPTTRAGAGSRSPCRAARPRSP